MKKLFFAAKYQQLIGFGIEDWTDTKKEKERVGRTDKQTAGKEH